MALEGTEERRAFTLLWRIENLSQSENDINFFRIPSPRFKVRNLDEKWWYLILYPKVLTKDDKDLRLSLHLSDEALRYPIDCECSILDSHGSPLVSGTVRNQVIHTSIVLPVCPTQEEVFVTRKSSFLPHDTLTVRCRIWKSRGELERAQHIFLLSRIEDRESSFVWPIERFSSLQLGKEVTAPVDLVLFRDDPDLLLGFSLTGESLLDSNVDFVITANSSLQDKFIKFKVSVLDYARKVMKCVEYTHLFRASKGKITWNISKFVSRQELLEKESECLSNGVLTLLCEFEVQKITQLIEGIYYGISNLNREFARNASKFSEVGCQTSHQSGDPPDVSQQRNDSMDILRGDFLFLYQEQTFSDFELRSEDVSFPVHKSVLSARSAVFRAMFSSDMKESESNFLDVPELDAHTLNRMLTFLYTGTVEHLQWEGAVKLYYAADKYQVSSLKQLCTSTLRSNIAMSNVCDILVLADRHQDQELTSFVHDFILRNFNEIMHSHEWENFLDKDPNLAGKTTHQLCKKSITSPKTNPVNT